MKKDGLNELLARLEAAPDDVQLLQRGGKAAEDSGDRDLAARLFGQAALVHLAQRGPLKAVALLRHALVLNPSALELREALARIYLRLGLLPEAYAQLALVLTGHRAHGESTAIDRTLAQLAELADRGSSGLN